MQLQKSIISLLPLLVTVISSFCQQWIKQPLPKTASSITAIYSWEEHNQFHSAGGEIILMKNGRFKYSAYQPLSFTEYSQGNYTISRGIITLNSDCQNNNIQVVVNYIDSLSTDSSYVRLSLIQNLDGDTAFYGYYSINRDTTVDGSFDPVLKFNKSILDSISSIKIRFYDTDCGSDWIPIKEGSHFIKVIVLTHQDLNELSERRYKVLKNWRLKITGDKVKQIVEIK